MILRAISFAVLSFGILSASMEVVHASTQTRTETTKEERGRLRDQRQLVTSMPAPDGENLDSALKADASPPKSDPQSSKDKQLDITLPSPSVRVGSKDVLMSPWMPVRSSLGVQMELTW